MNKASFNGSFLGLTIIKVVNKLQYTNIENLEGTSIENSKKYIEEGVHKMTCRDCDKFYICQTGRALKTCLKSIFLKKTNFSYI